MKYINNLTSTKLILSTLIVSCFTSCTLFQPMGLNTGKDDRTVVQRESDPVTIRRKIKDVDYRKSPEELTIKKRLVVLPFLDKEPQKRTEASRQNAHRAFVFDLQQSDKYLVIEPEELTIDYIKFIVNHQYDLRKLSVEASKQGVTTLVEGQIIDVRLKKRAEPLGLIRKLSATYEVVVRLRVQNARSQDEVFHTVKTVTLEEDNTRIAERTSEDDVFIKNPKLVEVLIKDAFLDFTPQIQEIMGEVIWEGRIAAIRGEKIYLNVGKMSGVQVGDLLKVVEPGSEIYDPEIGYNLGKISGKSKGTLEIISYFGNDGAVAIVHSGAGFKESDRVEMYQ